MKKLPRTSRDPRVGRPRAGRHRWTLLAALAVAGLLAGCAHVAGPAVEFTAPRVSGRVVDAASGLPVVNARVGRRLYVFRDPTGGFRKGGEELRLLSTYVRSDAEGRFELPAEKAVFLVRFGIIRPNLRLTVQRGGWHAWSTNWPDAALGKDGATPGIDAGDIPLTGR